MKQRPHAAGKHHCRKCIHSKRLFLKGGEKCPLVLVVIIAQGKLLEPGSSKRRAHHLGYLHSHEDSTNNSQSAITHPMNIEGNGLILCFAFYEETRPQHLVRNAIFGDPRRACLVNSKGSRCQPFQFPIWDLKLAPKSFASYLLRYEVNRGTPQN